MFYVDGSAQVIAGQSKFTILALLFNCISYISILKNAYSIIRHPVCCLVPFCTKQCWKSFLLQETTSVPTRVRTHACSNFSHMHSLTDPPTHTRKGQRDWNGNHKLCFVPTQALTLHRYVHMICFSLTFLFPFANRNNSIAFSL